MDIIAQHIYLMHISVTIRRMLHKGIRLIKQLCQTVACSAFIILMTPDSKKQFYTSRSPSFITWYLKFAELPKTDTQLNKHLADSRFSATNTQNSRKFAGYIKFIQFMEARKSSYLNLCHEEQLILVSFNALTSHFCLNRQTGPHCERLSRL